MYVLFCKHLQHAAEWEEYYGVDKAFSEVLLKPALSASFNEGPVFSAAEMLMFSHLYFMGDAEVYLWQ